MPTMSPLLSPSFKSFTCAVGLALASLGAQATVLTFEDRPDAAGPLFFDGTYQGFDFGDNNPDTNAWASNNANFATHSGNRYVATDSTLYPTLDVNAPGPLYGTQAITSAQAFVFDGAWFSGFGKIRYDLYLGTQFLGSSDESADLSASLSVFVASGYTGLVDKVVVFGYQGFYALDDFTFNSLNDTEVPEPGSLALVLLAGAAGAGAVHRRKATSRPD